MEVSRSLSTYAFETVRINEHGHTISKQPGAAQSFTEPLPEGAFIEMVKLPARQASVGSPLTEKGRMPDEDEPHLIAFDTFFISKHPITQFQWRAVASLPQIEIALDTSPSHFTGLGNPVEQVSWFDAVEFCARLSRHTQRSYRLPTEVEWEYACRGATETPFCFGEMLTPELANYQTCGIKELRLAAQNSDLASETEGHTTAVDGFAIANPFGLYDMHGNVCEWCLKSSHDEFEIEDLRYQQPTRGGSWKSSPLICRAAVNIMFASQTKDSSVGFRVVHAASPHPTNPDDSASAITQSLFSGANIGGNVTIYGDVNQTLNIE